MQVVRIPKAGHFPSWTHPEEIVAILTGLVERYSELDSPRKISGGLEEVHVKI
jgi:hypothetical protein